MNTNVCYNEKHLWNYHKNRGREYLQNISKFEQYREYYCEKVCREIFPSLRGDFTICRCTFRDKNGGETF